MSETQVPANRVKRRFTAKEMAVHAGNLRTVQVLVNDIDAAYNAISNAADFLRDMAFEKSYAAGRAQADRQFAKFQASLGKKKPTKPRKARG